MATDRTKILLKNIVAQLNSGKEGAPEFIDAREGFGLTLQYADSYFTDASEEIVQFIQGCKSLLEKVEKSGWGEESKMMAGSLIASGNELVNHQ